MMKTVIPLLLAVVFSNSALAGDSELDANMQLQRQVQSSAQSVIDARLEQNLNTPQISISELVYTRPESSKPKGAVPVLSRLMKETSR